MQPNLDAAQTGTLNHMAPECFQGLATLRWWTSLFLGCAFPAHASHAVSDCALARIAVLSSASLALLVMLHPFLMRACSMQFLLWELITQEVLSRGYKRPVRQGLSHTLHLLSSEPAAPDSRPAWL